ncbi:unnamed protein product, partial [Ectocarpus sp. 12 AP-2014]
ESSKRLHNNTAGAQQSPQQFLKSGTLCRRSTRGPGLGSHRATGWSMQLLTLDTPKVSPARARRQRQHQHQQKQAQQAMLQQSPPRRRPRRAKLPVFGRGGEEDDQDNVLLGDAVCDSDEDRVG